MAVNKGCVALVVMAVFSVMSTEAFWVPRMFRPQCTKCYEPQKNDCGTPPDGEWLIEHYWPEGKDGKRVLVGTTKMQLQNVFENVYSGIGPMSMYDHELVGDNVRVKLVGMFDYNSCVLGGALFNVRERLQNMYMWTYDQKTMSMIGHSVTEMHRKLLYSTTSVDRLVYMGKKNISPVTASVPKIES